MLVNYGCIVLILNLLPFPIKSNSILRWHFHFSGKLFLMDLRREMSPRQKSWNYFLSNFFLFFLKKQESENTFEIFLISPIYNCFKMGSLNFCCLAWRSYNKKRFISKKNLGYSALPSNDASVSSPHFGNGILNMLFNPELIPAQIHIRIKHANKLLLQLQLLSLCL